MELPELQEEAPQVASAPLLWWHAVADITVAALVCPLETVRATLVLAKHGVCLLLHKPKCQTSIPGAS